MEHDDTCIARAIVDNDLEMLQLLIKSPNADLNFAIRCNRTPIIMAIRTDNLPALKKLVKAGADPCLADQFGVPPIEFLKENNSPELRKYFKAVVARHKKKVPDTPKK